jgi:hypothetical protein
MTTPIDPETIAHIPAVTCKHCGRVAQCRRTKDGTLYRPFTWAFVDASALVGVCNFCQATLPRFGLPNLDAFTVEAPSLGPALIHEAVSRICGRPLTRDEIETGELEPMRLGANHRAALGAALRDAMERASPPSLASSAALAFRGHGATLRALAVQEREDAARGLVIPSAYGSADAAPALEPVKVPTMEECAATLGPLIEKALACPGCSACVPLEGEVRP